MFDLKDFSLAINQIAEEKGISKDKILEAIEQAIAAAYKKEYMNKSNIVRAKIDPETGEVKFWQVKIVVDKNMLKEEEEEGDKIEKEEGSQLTAVEQQIKDGDVVKKIKFNPERHILLEEAQVIKPEAKPGEEIIFPLESHEEFGRIAAQTAKQVILQRLREAEKETVLQEFKNKEGELVSGIIQRIENRNVYVNLGRVDGVMFYNEAIPNERYRIGERMKFYLLAVQENTKGPMIILSRSHPKFISKLFEMEVPEIASGVVKIMAIAREAGFRSKVAVHSTVAGVDPIGSCVGQKGTRIMAVLNELGQEKIDIIKWSEDPEEFVAQALSPAKVSRVEMHQRREMRVFVPEDQLSLAIGKGGQNVRLAAKLTGWKIDVRSEAAPDQVVQDGVAEAEADSSTEEVTLEKVDNINEEKQDN
ncbi:MAG: transcription termination factor NusA [Minisyncoccia bacterium]